MHISEAGPKRVINFEPKPKITEQELGKEKRRVAKGRIDKDDPAYKIPDSNTDIQQYLEENKE